MKIGLDTHPAASTVHTPFRPHSRLRFRGVPACDRAKTALAIAALLAATAGLSAQTLPGLPTPPATAPAEIVPMGPTLPPAPLSPEARDTLQVLHDRKDTLKDFTGKIDYSVEDGRTGDLTGKVGTVDFVMDPTKGPTFSASFTMNRTGRKPKEKFLAYNIQFIFDGRDFTIKDWGLNDNTKQFVHSTLLPAGAKPGDAATLSGAMPLPIGLDVDDVARNFDVTALPAKNADEAVVKLVPRNKKRFDYEELVVTLDKKQQLPVRLVETGANGDITTILLQELQINTGKAKLANAETPAKDGWREMAANTPK